MLRTQKTQSLCSPPALDCTCFLFCSLGLYFVSLLF
ncbi:unnamed protein product [Rhodiola kirilowii]